MSLFSLITVDHPSVCSTLIGALLLLTAGITLALFGGVRKHSMDRNKVPIRGDIHVIVVGMLNFSSVHLKAKFM